VLYCEFSEDGGYGGAVAEIPEGSYASPRPRKGEGVLLVPDVLCVNGPGFGNVAGAADDSAAVRENGE
jgi:hypothetical protein